MVIENGIKVTMAVMHATSKLTAYKIYVDKSKFHKSAIHSYHFRWLNIGNHSIKHARYETLLKLLQYDIKKIQSLLTGFLQLILWSCVLFRVKLLQDTVLTAGNKDVFVFMRYSLMIFTGKLISWLNNCWVPKTCKLSHIGLLYRPKFLRWSIKLFCTNDVNVPHSDRLSCMHCP